MNEIKLIETNGSKLLIVEVPEEATDFTVEYYGLIAYKDLNADMQAIKIPSFSWQIYGKSTELSEEQMEMICDEISSFGKTYWKDYRSGNSFCEGFSLQESYLSWLQANEIVDRNPYGECIGYDISKGKWQEAQSKVKHYLILIKK